MAILHFQATPVPEEVTVNESTKAAAGSAECPICGKDTPHGHHKHEVQSWVNGLLARWHLTAKLWANGELEEKLADAWQHGYRSCIDDYDYARRTGGDATTPNPFLAKKP